MLLVVFIDLFTQGVGLMDFTPNFTQNLPCPDNIPHFFPQCLKLALDGFDKFFLGDFLFVVDELRPGRQFESLEHFEALSRLILKVDFDLLELLEGIWLGMVGKAAF